MILMNKVDLIVHLNAGNLRGADRFKYSFNLMLAVSVMRVTRIDNME
tara:strand:+ start:432 stop:572 length:141 start_codon:yes stop_codon:yes gene_type:complete